MSICPRQHSVRNHSKWALVRKILDEAGTVLRCVIPFYRSLQVHRLVVVDGDHHVVGVVSLSDILKFLVLVSHSK